MARTAMALLALVAIMGLAAAQDGFPGYPLDCPDSTDTGLAGGFSTNTDMEAQQAGLSAAWEAAKANAAQTPLPAEAEGCNVNEATITPTSACSQVVAGTNWILAGEMTFPDCDATMELKANVYVGLDGAPVVNAYSVTAAAPPAPEPEPAAPGVIANWGQCGGMGGECAALAADMNVSVASVCANKPFPSMVCDEGYECLPESIYYWQCRPSVSLTCPPSTDEDLAGGFSTVANATDLQFVADAAWVDATAADPSAGLPPNTTCDVANASRTPLSGCQQVVGGGAILSIVTFKVTFPNCALHTTVDARVVDNLDGTADVEGMRMAPYQSADSYEECGDDGQCQLVLVFPMWSQCGGTGPACANAAERLGEPADGFCGAQPFPHSTCEYGAECTELNPDYFQCMPAESA